MAERQAEIMFSEKLPSSERADGRHRVGWRKPCVEPGTAEPRISPPLEIAMEHDVHRQIFDNQQSWTPVLQIESLKHRDFMAFHIDRDIIDRRRRVGLMQDFVES